MAALAGALSAGCAGHGLIHMVPVAGKQLTTTSTLIVKVSPDECYYWVNDKQELCIAMRETGGSLLGGRFEHDFTLSLVLAGPPAGPARHYRLNRYSLRAQNREGLAYTRSASLTGEAVVWDYDTSRLHGRFRLIAKHQSYSVLTGWRGDARVSLVGELTAVPDRQAGERILALTEKDGMARKPSHARPRRVKKPAQSRLRRGTPTP
jgi:hypothetical protein